MSVLAPGLSWIDLKFRGSPHVIATAVVSDSAGVALIDPGPASCLETLELGLNAQGMGFSDVTHILLTHVHLDHAGATGTLVRQYRRVGSADHVPDALRSVRRRSESLAVAD
jgi:glyoxylase-like metal-dependent hydrolase (beta-lactamase superfamily II)